MAPLDHYYRPTVWYNTKSALVAAKRPGDLWIIARDVCAEKGAKAFAWFTRETIAVFLTRSKVEPDAHYYEVVENMRDHPVYIVMDVDRSIHPEYDAHIYADTDAFFAEFLDVFERKWAQFVCSIYQQEMQLELGNNYNVCTAHSATKMSCHIRIAMPCKHMAHLKQIMTNFHRFISSNIHTTPEEQAHFFYYKNGKQTCVIDMAIYTNFRSMRLMYSAKWKPGAVRLAPHGASSPKIADHLFNAHDPSNNAFPFELDERDELVQADFSRAGETHVSVKTAPVPAETRAYVGDTAIEPKVIDAIKAHILTHPKINCVFKHKSPLKITAHNFVTPLVYAFHTEGVACPYSTSAAAHARALADLGELLACLGDARADDYQEWLNVGFALHSVSHERALLNLWIAFSKKSQKYKAGVCEYQWGRMEARGGGVTCGTLHMWAKQDAPQRYKDLLAGIGARGSRTSKGLKEVSHDGCFEYHHARNLITYKCCDPKCKIVQCMRGLTFHLQPLADVLELHNTLTASATLHDKHDVIRWDSSYDAPSMQPYSVAPITVIRGQMGVGKTQALMEFMSEHFKEDTKALVVTYSRLLAQKYHAMFTPFGFVSYMSKRKDAHIDDPRVIVCLDSLWRVATSNFDCVIVDEAVSVLLHFNSSLMARRAMVSSKFELSLLQAKSVYMLDACADNGIVYDTVQYLSRRKNVPVRWIKNSHIRSSNRKVNATVCTQPQLENQLRAKATAHVLALLEDGKRVVVSSSTKGFTEKLEAAIKAHAPSMRVLVHNSESDKSLLRDPAALWPEYDVVIYSPTITAGVSFEREHFDQLVAYIENSFHTPSVDLALQQLFRVRQLKDGDMTLFVNSSLKLAREDYPVCEKDIAAWLDRNVTALHRYYPDNCLSYESNTVVSDGHIRYDDNILSYRILVGIVANRNRSLTHFGKILFNTLTQDYAIPVATEYMVEDESDRLKWVMQLQASLEAANKDVLNAEFTRDMIPDMAEYAELRGKEASGEAMTSNERQRKWVYDAMRMWGVEKDKVDAAFYKGFIGPFTMANRKAMFNKYYTARRLGQVLANDLETNRSEFARFIDSIKDNGADYNICLYKTQMITFYRRVITGQAVLNAVMPQEFDPAMFLRGEKMVMASDELAARMASFVTSLDDAGFKEVLEVFDMRCSTYPSRDVVAAGPKKLRYLAQGVLDSFGLYLETESRGTKNKALKNYGKETKRVHCPDMSKLVTQYDATVFSFVLKNKSDGSQLDLV